MKPELLPDPKPAASATGVEVHDDFMLAPVKKKP